MSLSDSVNATESDSTDESGAEPFVDWQCFAYLTAEKSEIYRAIVDAFANAKAEFTLHMRPAQIRDALRNDGFPVESNDIEAALQQLEAWGNLQSYQDNADVASLVVYYQKRLLYQMTAAGEAAQASTLTFVERLQQQAKLDARALERIAESAGELQNIASTIEASPAAADSGVVLRVVRSVCQDADELTSRAQSFFRWLHEQTESDRGDLEAFLSYKERLIDYLQQFVTELITRGGEIARRLNAISDTGYATLSQLTAQEEVGSPRAGEESSHEQRLVSVARRWEQRLLALRGWFSRGGGKAAQLEQLRAAARAAIPRLLQLAGQMNERQSGRSDRVADLKTLAAGFLACRDDKQAHRLYRAAFALSPARHLRVDQATLDALDQNPAGPSTRWLDAEPVEFAPQLRKTGRQPVAASNRRAVDRSRQKAAAKRRLTTEAGRTDSSRETLIALGRCRLSEVGELDADSFRLMMELIELAVARPASRDFSSNNGSEISVHEPATSTTEKSRDGLVQITVRPVEAVDHSNPEAVPAIHGHESEPDFGIARLSTEAGFLMLPDMWIEVTRGS